MLRPAELPIHESRICPGIYSDALITNKGVRLHQRALGCLLLRPGLSHRKPKRELVMYEKVS